MFDLVCHPATQPPTGVSVAASARRLAGGVLRFGYRIRGVEAVRLPLPAAHAHTEGLWRATCCEAFVARADEAEYREFNFSPSGAWASYHFAEERMLAEARNPVVPACRCQVFGDEWFLFADLAVPLGLRALHINLAVVVEDHEGILSYWALTHPGPRPDFHRRDGFVLVLPQESP